MTGIVWLVHGMLLLRAAPGQLRPATAAMRVMGELQDRNLDVFTQVVGNLPRGVTVDLTGQAGPGEEYIDEDTIVVKPPDQTDQPSPEADPYTEPATTPPSADVGALVLEPRKPLDQDVLPSGPVAESRGESAFPQDVQTSEETKNSSAERVPPEDQPQAQSLVNES